MMIDNAISKIYQQDKKVFIPEFGALIYSEFDDDIDFNPHLNFDDGKIILEIQKQDSISEDEAKKSLEEYVEQLKANLESKGTHLIGGIGYINKGEDGELTIAKSISEPVILDEEEIEATNLEEEKVEEETLTDDELSVEQDDIVPDEQIDVNPENSHEQEKSLEDDEIALEEEQENADDLEKGQEGAQSENSEASSMLDDHENEEESIQPDYSYQAEEDDSFQLSEEEPESPQKKRSPILVTLVAILILAVIAVPLYLFVIKPAQADNHITSESIKPTDEKLDDIKSEQEKEKASIVENVPTSSEEAEPNETKNETNSVSDRSIGINAGDQKIYSLILGSFKVEDNADNFEQILDDKGLEVSKFRRNNSFYFVGIEQITGKPNAVRLLAELREEEEPTAWIIKKL